MDIIIRKAKDTDADAIAQIASEEWADIYNSYEKLLGNEIYCDVFTNPLEEKAKSIKNQILTLSAFVAECDGIVCAFAIYNINGKNGILSNNAVSGNYRGRGIAKMLYNSVFDEMRKHGVKTVKVSTGLDDAHAPARRAYEKAGFEVGLPQITYYKKLK